MRFLGFLWNATVRGTTWLNGVLGWAGSILLLLALLAGVALPSLLKAPWWVPATIIVVIVLAVFVAGAYRMWDAADKRAQATTHEASGGIFVAGDLHITYQVAAGTVPPGSPAEPDNVAMEEEGSNPP
jgi:thiol:disulfide interchange protein